MSAPVTIGPKPIPIREQLAPEIKRLSAQGFSMKAIARELVVTEWTVRSVLSNKVCPDCGKTVDQRAVRCKPCARALYAVPAEGLDRLCRKCKTLKPAAAFPPSEYSRHAPCCRDCRSGLARERHRKASKLTQEFDRRGKAKTLGVSEAYAQIRRLIADLDETSFPLHSQRAERDAILADLYAAEDGIKRLLGIYVPAASRAS